MKKFSFNLKTKLILGFGAITVLTAVLSGFSYYSLSQINSKTASVLELSKAMDDIVKFKHDVFRFIELHKMYLSGNKNIQSEININDYEMRVTIDNLKAQKLNQDEQVQIAKIITGTKELLKNTGLYDQILSGEKEVSIDEKKEFLELIDGQIKTLTDNTISFYKGSQKKLLVAANTTQELQETSLVISSTISSLVFLIIAISSTLLYNSIITPIKKITQATKKITQGLFDQKITIKRNDELGLLAEAFNKMCHSLKIAQSHLADVQQKQYHEKIAEKVAKGFSKNLGNILGNAVAIQGTVKDNETVNQKIEKIMKSAEDSMELTENLKRFSNQKFSENVEISLNDIINHVAKQAQKAAKDGVQIRTKLSKSIAPIKGDSTKILQAITNLANNALDAMPDGGVLTFQDKNYTVSDKDHHDIQKLVNPGDYVWVVIRDTGVGIDEENIPKVTEPFFTTKANDKAMGLGLSTVKEIIEQHGGKIIFDSTIDQGTWVHLFLPFKTDEETQETEVTENTEGTEEDTQENAESAEASATESEQSAAEEAAPA